MVGFPSSAIDYRAGAGGFGFFGFFSSLRWRSRLPMILFPLFA